MGQYADKYNDLIINEMTKAQYESLLAQNLISDTELYFITDDNYRDLFYLKGETYSKTEIDRMFGDLSGLELDNYYTKTETNQAISTEVSKIIGAAPEAYDTLKEVADYIESDLSNASAMLASIANKANSADVYTKSEANAKYALKSDIPAPTDLSNYYTKQETLGVIDTISGLDNYYDKDETDAKLETIKATKQDVLQSNVNIKTINGQSILGSGNITIQGGTGTGGGDGTTVVANPELTGDETKLRGITIADTNYSVMASEMSFSDVPVASDLKLANIQIGQDNWSIVSEAWVNTKFNDKTTELKNYTDTKIANLVNSAPEALDTLGEISTLLQENDSLIDGLLTEVGKKANAAETYTKTETDNKYVEKTTLDANPVVNEITPRLESLRVNGTDYIVSPDVSLVLTGTVDADGTKTVTKMTVNDDVWNLPVAGEALPGTGNVDLTGYATEDWVNAQGFIKEHQSLDGYATESWVEGKNYLTEHQSLAGYATESYVNTKVADLVGTAPETLDTLQELATAITENDTLTDTLNQAIGNKADKSEIVTSYLELTDKPTIPNITYSEEVPEDTSTMNTGDVVLVPSAGGSSGGAEYEMKIITTEASTAGTFTSSNVLFWTVFMNSVNFHGSATIPTGFTPSSSWSNCLLGASTDDSIKISNSSDSEIVITAVPSNTRFSVFAFRKK